MWPFTKRKKPWLEPQKITFSQADLTEHFGGDVSLRPEEWIVTLPINRTIKDPETQGLPALDATEDEIYAAAERLSQLRESIAVPNDGVYCPVCHIANVQLDRLRTPCPTCRRPLLKFGWD